MERLSTGRCTGLAGAAGSVPLHLSILKRPLVSRSAETCMQKAKGHENTAARRAVPPLVGCAISALMILVGVTRAAGAQTQTEEYRVKAALLFHFAQLVDWPPSAFASDASAINLCTVGQDPFNGQLEATLDGKSVGMRPVRIVHLKDLHEVASCHLLFVGSNENKRAPSVLMELGKAPVMTVGESDGFLEQGGMVRLDVAEGKVRFAINLDASEQAGLKISSRMLLLAETVVGKHK